MTKNEELLVVTEADEDAAEKWKALWGTFATELPVEDLAYALARHRTRHEEALDVSDRAREAKVLASELRAKASYTDRTFDNHSLGELYRRAASAIEALSAPTEAALDAQLLGWASMDNAPKDGSEFWALSDDVRRAGLSPFVSKCAWHPNAGFCTDELREPVMWRPIREGEVSEDCFAAVASVTHRALATPPAPVEPMGNGWGRAATDTDTEYRVWRQNLIDRALENIADDD